MIFFVANDGTVISSVPSPVYQGSANANNVYLVAPFAANLQVTVAFKLPNGVWTERFLMTPAFDIPDVVNKQSGKSYVGWQFSLPNEITQYFGTVTAQFFFYAGRGVVLTASSSTSFTVERGVPEILPPTPSADIYNQIIDNLSTLSEQLKNGTYAARAVYQWNSTYTYGAGEITYYADFGEYGVFVKSLVANNRTEPYTDGVLNSQNWQLISDFNILTELYGLKSEMEEALAKSQKNAAAAANSAATAESAMLNAQQSATVAQEAADSIKASADYLESVKDGTVAVPKAVSDDTGTNIAEHFTDIEELIPSTASAENQLADKAFVNSSINNMAAFYITSNATGDAFSTRASLLAATTFYSGGVTRVPTQNDYAIVLADESQPKGVDGNYPTTRYSYQGGTYPDGQWDFQYVVNNTSLTQAQVDAINSGITAQKIANMDAATAAKYTKPSGGIPESDLSADVQSKINANSSAPIKNLYNLGAFDTYVSNGDGTGTITRKTGYISYNELKNGNGIDTNELNRFLIYVDGAQEIYKPYWNTSNNADPVTDSLEDDTGIQAYTDGYLYVKVKGLAHTVDAFAQWLLENKIVIQYKLSSLYQYEEKVVENQPIRPANQDEEYYWHGEWRKALNLFNNQQMIGTYTYNCDALIDYPTGRLYIASTTNNNVTKYAYSELDLNSNTVYTFTVSGTNNYFNSARIYRIVENGGEEIAPGIYGIQVADTQTVATITTDSGSHYALLLYLDSATTSGNYSYVDLMLVRGSHPYPYESYNGGILHEKDLSGLKLYQHCIVIYNEDTDPEGYDQINETIYITIYSNSDAQFNLNSLKDYMNENLGYLISSSSNTKETPYSNFISFSSNSFTSSHGFGDIAYITFLTTGNLTIHYTDNKSQVFYNPQVKDFIKRII